MDYATKELRIALTPHNKALYNFHRLIMEANKRYYNRKNCRAYVDKLKALRTEIAFREMVERNTND